MAIALDIIKKKTGLDDTMAQQALDIKNTKGNDAFKEFVNTNKPVQPSPVTPTPVAPTPNTPAPIVNSPVDPTTGLSKPLEPVAQPVPAQPVQKVPVAEPVTAEVKPLEPVKTEVASSVTPKVEAPIDYNQAKGREQDIINNLNTFKAQNMTPEQIMKASDYQNATPEKRALIEPYLKVQTPTASAMYNAIATKMDIPDEQKTSLPYKIASNRYAKANMYSSMTPSQLETEIKNAKLVEGSQAYEDLKAMNPKLVQDTENLRKVNGGKTNIFSYVNNPDGTKVKVNNLENTFAQDYIENFGDIIKQMYTVQTPEQIRAIIRTPDAAQAEDKAFELEGKIDEIDKLIEESDKKVEESLAGTGASGQRIQLEKQSQRENLEKDKRSIEKDYTRYANKANSIITQNTSLYLNSQAQKEKQAQAMLPILQDQYKTAQAKAQAEQALNDPAKAIPAMIEEYKKLGVPFTRSTQQVIKDFESSGQDIATFLTDLQKTIQSKPEYKAYIDKKSGTEWQSTSITRYNPSTGANESTPIFYRKKTNGEFEAVDLSGNPIDSSVLSGGDTSTTPGTLPRSFSGDTTSYIASKEGFRDTAYQDSSGVWTIGYGTTKINGKPIQPGQKITQAEAQAQLGADIAKHSNWKNYIDESTLSDSQKTALASFEYNLGPGIWDKGAVNIINMVKSGDLAGAGKEMQKYVNAGGKVIKGLQNRRAEEAKLLQTTGTSATPVQQVSASDQKAFESYDGKSIPEQYKTPAEKKAFVDKYNAWRATRPGTKIETGNDILNIKIDKPTEGQSASQSYTSRMLNAVNNLMPLEKKFLELGTGGQVAQTYLPSLLKSSDQKMMDAEKKNFITAVLRKQSGASIAPSEFAGEEMKYFPQPGDSKEVVIAKQNARNAEIKAMLATAGVDAEGNSLSKYYNPPVIVAEQINTPPKTDKISTLKKNYFPQ